MERDGMALTVVDVAARARAGMGSAMGPISVLVLLFVAVLFLLSPAAVEAAGRVIDSDLAGVMRIVREDGSTATIDYSGRMRVGLHQGQIAIDFTGYGVVQETGEGVAFSSQRRGVFERVRNGISFEADGDLTLVRENGSRIAICPTGYGVIQQEGRNIVIDIIDAGVVEATGENVTIYTTGTGELQ